ncbi:hypothetical protein KSS87_004694, partial [Heliosperma pusillum]
MVNLKALVIPLFLSLLLFPLVLSASNDGLLRIGLKKRKIDQNSRDATQLGSKGRASLQNHLLKNFGDVEG